MADSKTPQRSSAKEKRARHASAQATYMERKRSEGKDWLATWVPGEAKDSFRNLAKRTNEETDQPDDVYIAGLEDQISKKVPDWAKANHALLCVWLLGETEASIDVLVEVDSKSDKKKKKKKKKKK